MTRRHGYNPITQSVHMQNDASVWSAFVALGTPITGWSTMCDLDTSSATPLDTNLSVTVRLIFKAPFVGENKTVSMRADSNVMGQGTWTPKGTWTVFTP